MLWQCCLPAIEAFQLFTPLLTAKLPPHVFEFAEFYTVEKANRCVACGEEGHYLRHDQQDVSLCLWCWSLACLLTAHAHAMRVCLACFSFVLTGVVL